MNSLIVKTGPGEVLLKIKTSNNSLRKQILHELLFSQFWSIYIPNIKINITSDSSNIDLPTIEYYPEIFPLEVTFRGSKMKIYGRWNNGICTDDIITLTEYLLEKLRQEKEVYCFHGSCAEICQNGVLIFGASPGLGKTMLALLLAKEGFFVSDEKFLLYPQQDFKIEGGVWKISVRNKYLAKILHCKKDIIFNLESKKEWKNRLKEKTKLNLIISPRIHPEFQTAGFYRWSEKMTEWHLYEEMTRKIRGVSRRICHFSYPINSIDNQKIAKKRIFWAKVIAQKIPAYTVYGNPKEVVKIIKEKLISTLRNV